MLFPHSLECPLFGRISVVKKRRMPRGKLPPLPRVSFFVNKLIWRRGHPSTLQHILFWLLIFFPGEITYLAEVTYFTNKWNRFCYLSWTSDSKDVPPKNGDFFFRKKNPIAFSNVLSCLLRIKQKKRRIKDEKNAWKCLNVCKKKEIIFCRRVFIMTLSLLFFVLLVVYSGQLNSHLSTIPTAVLSAVNDSTGADRRLLCVVFPPCKSLF